MADRGIIFSAPMVRALLAGTKTQTRRLLTPYPSKCEPQKFQRVAACKLTGRIVWEAWGDRKPCNAFPVGKHGVTPILHTASEGDRLYVRETCRAEELSRPPVNRPATKREREVYARTTMIECDDLDGADGVRYSADGEWIRIESTLAAGEAWSALFYYRGRGKDRIGNQVPGIHMPRWASRIWLAVTDVRVQRLHEISEADCLAEGIDDLATSHFGTPIKAYAGLWNSLHGAEGTRWEDNPWVCATNFTVHHGNIDSEAAHG